MLECDQKKIEHFGRVHIRSKETGSWTLLDFAYFSKLDLKVYSKDRTNLHPDSHNLIGKKFSLGYRMKDSNHLNKAEEESSGKFLAPIKLGENPPPDLEHLTHAFDVELKWCQEMNLENPKELVKTTLACAMWMFCMPGKSVLEQDFVHSTTPLLYIHDTDSSEIFSRFKKDFLMNQPYRNLMELASKVVSGNFVTAAEIDFLKQNLSADASKEVTELLLKIQKSVLALKEVVIETAEKHGMSAKNYFKVLDSTVLALCVEVCNEWRSKLHLELAPTITAIHKESALGFLIVETIFLHEGITLSERIRENPLFQIYISLFKTSFAKVNDVVSYGRQGDSEENPKEIYLLHKGMRWPLDKAVKKVEDDANEATDQLMKMSNLLLEMYPETLCKEHYNLKRYLQTTNDVLIGHMQYYTFAKRYHPGMVLDCYIHELEV